MLSYKRLVLLCVYPTFPSKTSDVAGMQRNRIDGSLLVIITTLWVKLGWRAVSVSLGEHKKCVFLTLKCQVGPHNQI